MKNKVNCIMLVDDNKDDNFFHERTIRKNDAANVVVVKQTGLAALEHLKSKSPGSNSHPDLIFLDINMPGMNGWDFLEDYTQLDSKFKSHIVVVMLTTSDDSGEMKKAKSFSDVSDFKTKPMTKEMLEEILGKWFQH